jgi:GNAT superfamily N-acetyltransferase
MSDARVRLARREDVARIWELLLGLARYERLEHEVTGRPERLAEDLFGAPPRVGCLVLEAEAEHVGYALFYPTYSSFSTASMMWLEDLYVVPERRGRGDGRALLAAVSRLAVERGCRRLGWIVLDWNEPSIRFYERLGAKRAGADWLQYGFDEAALAALADPSRAT